MPPLGPLLVEPLTCEAGLEGKLKGICPTVLGKVTVSFPPGLMSPKRASATAVPPCEPGYQASRMAGTCLSAQLMVSGRPLMRTSTTGLPVAIMAWSRSSCRPGRSRPERDLFSPQVRVLPPNTTMATSLLRACSTALSISLCSCGVSGSRISSLSGQLASTKSHPWV